MEENLETQNRPSLTVLIRENPELTPAEHVAMGAEHGYSKASVYNTRKRVLSGPEPGTKPRRGRPPKSEAAKAAKAEKAPEAAAPRAKRAPVAAPKSKPSSELRDLILRHGLDAVDAAVAQLRAL